MKYIATIMILMITSTAAVADEASFRECIIENAITKTVNDIAHNEELDDASRAYAITMAPTFIRQTLTTHKDVLNYYYETGKYIDGSDPDSVDRVTNEYFIQCRKENR